MPEAMVEIDSDDSRFLTLGSDALRGASAGDGRGVLALRGGGRGGSAGETLGFSDSCTTMGWLPSCRADVGALLRTGGLLTVWRE